MSTQPTTGAPPTTRLNEIVVFSHSTLFYWWPVWAIGFILALITAFQGHKMVVVPSDSVFKEVLVPYEVGDTTQEIKKTVVAPPQEGEIDTTIPMRRITPKQGYGVVFGVVLLVVIVITNVPLRGLWSVLIIVTVLLGTVIIALAGWWDNIVSAIALLDIRINVGGYIFIALALFVIWLVTFLFFDRQIYMTFTPGQFKVRLEIGMGEKTYDTRGMTIEKLRSDLFRHWILGLGSGDLIVRTSGADSHEFRLNNVLFIGHKLQLIEEMQRVHPDRSY